MKFIYTLLVTVLLAFTSNAQKGLYVKYELDIKASGEEADMMVMMMNGSSMELAFSKELTVAKTQMGSMISMSLQYDVEKDEILMLMSGMMGNMAFQGKAEELEEEGEEADQNTEGDLELINETKKIMGYKCKKAIMTNKDGNKAVYWYTEDIARPDGLKQMPNQIPGLCLEMDLSQEGMNMIYKVVSLKEDVNMQEYIVKVPEGVEVQPLKDMKTMGGGF